MQILIYNLGNFSQTMLCATVNYRIIKERKVYINKRSYIKLYLKHFFMRIIHRSLYYLLMADCQFISPQWRRSFVGCFV